jgi:hypothetical protein
LQALEEQNSLLQRRLEEASQAHIHLEQLLEAKTVQSSADNDMMASMRYRLDELETTFEQHEIDNKCLRAELSAEAEIRARVTEELHEAQAQAQAQKTLKSNLSKPGARRTPVTAANRRQSPPNQRSTERSGQQRKREGQSPRVPVPAQMNNAAAAPTAKSQSTHNDRIKVLEQQLEESKEAQAALEVELGSEREMVGPTESS